MEIGYLNNIKNNFIVLKNSNILVNDYRLNMLLKNNIKGFLKISIGCVDGEAEISYEVSSKQSLKELFERKKMKYEELYVVIEGLINIIKMSVGYLLKPDDIILEPELIFTNYEVNEIWFCYYPNLGKHFKEEVKNFAGDLLAVTNHSDMKAVRLIYNFYDICNKKDVSLEEMENCLYKKDVSYEENVFGDSKYDKVCEDNSKIYGKIYEIEKSENRKSVDAGFFSKISKKIFKSGFDKNIKKWKISEREQEGESENLNEIKYDEPQEEYSNETMYVSEILDYSVRKLLSLSEQDNIEITTYPFIIGKLNTRADYIFNDRLISRMHVKITKEDNDYYIEDMNSKNGTFINDVRLYPYERKKVEIGDKIKIAKYDYIFR